MLEITFYLMTWRVIMPGSVTAGQKPTSQAVTFLLVFFFSLRRMCKSITLGVVLVLMTEELRSSGWT